MAQSIKRGGAIAQINRTESLSQPRHLIDRRTVGDFFCAGARLPDDCVIAHRPVIVREHHDCSGNNGRIIPCTRLVFGGHPPPVNYRMAQRHMVRVIESIQAVVGPPGKVQGVQHISHIFMVAESITATTAGVPKESGEQRRNGQTDENFTSCAVDFL